MKISIAQDFSVYPAGRFRTDGDFSAQAFREDWLVPHFGEEPLEVDLDGTRGFDSSFLEEAFGGLVRSLGLKDLQVVRQHLVISSSLSAYCDEVWAHIAQAIEAQQALEADQAAEHG
jgi:hypothetical protein